MGAFLAKTPQQLGAILRGYRLQRGLTQEELGEQLGLPQKAISLAETRPERMSIERLFRMLGMLGVELTLNDGRTTKPHQAEW